MKGVSEAREQKGGFLIMLLGALGASWLRYLLTGKGTIRVGVGKIRVSDGQN